MPESLPTNLVVGSAGHVGDHNELHGFVESHPGVTTGVHGVGASTVESVAGANAKVAAHDALATAHTGTLASLGSVNNFTAAQRISVGEPRFDVRSSAFNGGDWSTPAARRATIAAAMTAWATNGGELNFPPGAHDLSGGTIVLPTTYASLHHRYHINGNAARLTTTSAHPIIADNMPAAGEGGAATAQNAAVNRAHRRFVVEGLHFIGNGTLGQVGLRVVGSYLSEFRGLTFENMGSDGLDLVFCLGAQVSNCGGKNNTRRTFRSRYGLDIDNANAPLWTGATATNSNSNETTFNNCRDYAANGQIAQFSLEGVGGAKLSSCIVEGGSPVDAIYFNHGGATTAKRFVLDEIHAENNPSGAVVRLIANGRVRITDLDCQQAGVTLIDARGSGDPTILVYDIPFTIATVPFACDAGAGRWHFEYFDSTGSLDPYATTKWVGGVIPTHRTSVRFSSGTETPGGNGLHLMGGYGVSVGGKMFVPGGIHGSATAPFKWQADVATGVFQWQTFDGAARKHGQRMAGTNAWVWDYNGTDLLTMTSAGHLSQAAGATTMTGKGATASRPAASVGAGAQWYDTSLNKPIWSDGTNWRDAAGTVV